jgi:hypothetical protein
MILDLRLLLDKSFKSDLISSLLQNPLQALDELIQNPAISYTENYKKCGTDTSANYISHVLKPIEPFPQSATRGCDNDACYNDDGAVP